VLRRFWREKFDRKKWMVSESEGCGWYGIVGFGFQVDGMINLEKKKINLINLINYQKVNKKS
jgi:hypothetical protein